VAAEVREVMWQARQDGRPVSSAALAAGVSEMAAWAWIQQRGGVRRGGRPAAFKVVSGGAPTWPSPRQAAR
jgi:hypothetical protein